MQSPNSYPYQVTEPIQPRKRETDLSLASSPTSKPIAAIEPKSAKNISGPPVYYPPNHELFASKEEGGGAWRAEVSVSNIRPFIKLVLLSTP